MAKANLSIAQVTAGFGITGLTLLNWRKGTATKEKLPHLAKTTPGGRVSIAFEEAKVRAWAKKHGLEFKLAEAGAAAESAKPGPKAKADKTSKPAKADKLDRKTARGKPVN